MNGGRMHITAALCWFDEPLSHLDRLVSSLAGFADRIVALDGRWEQFPHARNMSPLEQSVALVHACDRYGIPLASWRNLADVPYPTQADKRDRLFTLCWLETDWILVVDGDHELTGSHPFARRLLSESDLDVAIVRTVSTDQRVSHKDGRQRLMFRAGAYPRMGAVHNEYLDAQGRCLSDRRHNDKTPALDLTELLELTHHGHQRGSERNRVSDEHYRLRGLHGEGQRANWPSDYARKVA